MIQLPKNICGVEGLLLAVIGRAVNDLAIFPVGHWKWHDAVFYLQSPLYRLHLEALGLPDDTLPSEVQGLLEGRPRLPDFLFEPVAYDYEPVEIDWQPVEFDYEPLEFETG